MVSACVTFYVTQVLHAKLSMATVAAAVTGHFLFPVRVGRTVPGELGAGLHDPDREKNYSYRKKNYKHGRPPPSSRPSSSSPVGEEGDDGEGGVVRGGEHVLDEQVRLAAVLWGGRDGVKGQTSFHHFLLRCPRPPFWTC